MKSKGFVRPLVDKWAMGEFGRQAIRGREQQLIDKYGGIGNPKVANSIRGVARYNINGYMYHSASDRAFGNIAPYTGF